MGRRPSIHDTGGNHLQRSSTQSRTRRGSGLDDINRMTYSYTTLWDVTLCPADSPRGAVRGAVFGASLIALFWTSATYPMIRFGHHHRDMMRRLDHAVIFVFIAGHTHRSLSHSWEMNGPNLWGRS